MGLMLFSGRQSKHAISALCLLGLLFGAASIAQETAMKEDEPLIGASPTDANNGMLPTRAEYDGPFNVANLNYPATQPGSSWLLGGGLDGKLTPATAEKYMMALKAHVEPDMRTLVENHAAWNAREAGWYNMVWRGGGEPGNPTSGREAIMNTNTGQIVPSEAWSENYRPTTEWVQNYGVIYYNGPAAYTLGQVFKEIRHPDPAKANFPTGSIIVKIEAATVSPEQWPWAELSSGGSVLNGAAEWPVYRPTTQDQKDYQQGKISELKNVVQTVHPFQLAIKVKDPIAAPQTGWVYMGFVYDARSKGKGAWDRFVPAGLMWGNDPKYATTPSGHPRGGDLEETWVNPEAPPFVGDTLGWGGRFAAPMDVAVRHGVIFPSGKRPDGGFRSSSCLSCHGTAQTPFTDNLYPSPNTSFPPDGDPFPLYEPGSPEWARWFQNLPGTQSMSGYDDVFPLDYDLSTMIALEIANGTMKGDGGVLEILNGH